MVSEPVLAPEAVGVNVTFTVHVAEGASEAPLQVSEEMAKSPDAESLEMNRELVPMLDTVTVCGALVRFTPWFPKLSDVGATEAPIDTVVFRL